MKIEDLQNKIVGIVGFGEKEGVATLNYLKKHGIKPVLFDRKPWEQWDKQSQDYIKSLEVNFIFGPGYLEELAGFDIIFRNPALWRLDPKLLEWEKKGLIVTSQTKWFFENCPAKIIGVTGTKGKGTTCALIFNILTENNLAGKKNQVFLTGNIGQDQALEILDSVNSEDLVVFELSSFQLQDLNISPHIAVTLMVTKDHLEHHKNIVEYVGSKENITKYQKPEDFSVFNENYDSSEKIGLGGRGKKLRVSILNEVSCGAFVLEESVQIKGILNVPDQCFSLSNLQLRGRHNLENICAAIVSSLIVGASSKDIQKSINEFKGLKHRLEFVHEINGVKFYDDSISTTEDTTIAAIQAFNEPEVLILGGASKNLDYSNLAQIISTSKKIKALIIIGQEALVIKSKIDQAGGFSGPISMCYGNMVEIVGQAYKLASPGDVVILSPACTSFDMFKNYKDRGDQFTKAALDLK